MTLFKGDDVCGDPSTLAFTDTSGYDPPGSGGTHRRSFTAAGTLTFFRAKLQNGSGSSIPLSVSWSETTLYSPAWSTNGMFGTFYSFQNTTTTALDGTLTLIDTAVTTVATASLSIPPGRTVATNTTALLVAAGRTGTARFTHNGPPGAIVAASAIANFASTPAYVQAVKFRAMRETR